jgi:hypothetical protein
MKQERDRTVASLEEVQKKATDQAGKAGAQLAMVIKQRNFTDGIRKAAAREARRVDYIARSQQSLLDDCKQQVLFQGLCNQHVMIRWCDCSLLIITTKRSRECIDNPFRQVMR